MGITKQRAAEACRAIARDEKERGKLYALLNRLPNERLAVVPKEESNEAIVAFLQAEMAGW